MENFVIIKNKEGFSGLYKDGNILIDITAPDMEALKQKAALELNRAYNHVTYHASHLVYDQKKGRLYIKWS